MMMLKQKNKNDERLRSGTSGIIESMSSEVKKKISGINISADEEIRKIEESVKTGIAEFNDSILIKTRTLIENEKEKILNRLYIEKKKRNLEIIDSFMDAIINEAVGSLSLNEGYYDFLENLILETIKEIKSTHITVKITERDMVFSEKIIKAVKENGLDSVINLKADESLKSGGAIVIDEKNEVIFNNSIERIIFRKTDVIRKEIFDAINMYRIEQMKEMQK